MPNITDFDVADILRVGLSGLCFLLAVLCYAIIRAEQNREGPPRKGIERMVYVFMVANLISSVLCFLAPVSSTEVEPLGGDYVVEHTSYAVDLSRWTPGGSEPVVITRTDRIRKNTSSQKDFTIPYATTGSDISCEPLAYTTKPRLLKKDDPLGAGVKYDYILPVGHQPKGYTETITTRFHFPNGFKDPSKEWWMASVPYFAHTIVVDFTFPSAKPCRTMDVATVAGDSAPVPISDNAPSVFDGGAKVKWVGRDTEARSKIRFDWQW